MSIREMETGGADAPAEESDDGGHNYLPELVLGLGLGAMALGFELIFSPPSPDAIFKHRALVAAFYAAQAVEVILGFLMLGIFAHYLKTTGVQRRRWHHTGKVFMVLAFLPVILTIILVVCAELTLA